MTKLLQVTLPYPPCVNHSHGYGKRRVFISDKVRAFRTYVAWKTALLDRFEKSLLQMDVKLYPADKRKRDIDSPIKQLFDALQHARVYDDDCQIKRLVVEMCEIRKGGEVEVMIRELV